MFKNYLQTAIRNLWKNEGFTAINIIGMATGLATCLLILFYVLDELSYDKYNVNADRIYRVAHDIKFGDNHFDIAQAPAAMGPESEREFPQVVQYVRFSWHDPVLVKKGDESLRETRVVYADSPLFGVFTLLCLGLFGLAAYSVEQRTREIGIRKVLGASVGNITGLLSKEFLKLIFIASLIAFPVGMPFIDGCRILPIGSISAVGYFLFPE